MNFKRFCGKYGDPCNAQRGNFLYKVYSLGPTNGGKAKNQVAIDIAFDQASCNPITCAARGSKVAESNPHINSNGTSKYGSLVIISNSQLQQLTDAGVFCNKPGVNINKPQQKGTLLGIGEVNSTLYKGKDGGWYIDPTQANLPSGVPNLPGISTATGQKSDNPRFGSFQKRWDKNEEVASAMRDYYKDHPEAAKKKAAKDAKDGVFEQKSDTVAIKNDTQPQGRVQVDKSVDFSEFNTPSFEKTDTTGLSGMDFNDDMQF